MTKTKREKVLVYKTGDRVRMTGTYGAIGLKGTLRSPGMAMFDWIVNLDIGEPMVDSKSEESYWMQKQRGE